MDFVPWEIRYSLGKFGRKIFTRITNRLTGLFDLLRWQILHKLTEIIFDLRPSGLKEFGVSWFGFLSNWQEELKIPENEYKYVSIVLAWPARSFYVWFLLYKESRYIGPCCILQCITIIFINLPFLVCDLKCVNWTPDFEQSVSKSNKQTN